MSVLIAGTFTSCEKYLPYINEDDVPNDTTGTDTTGSGIINTDCAVSPLRYKTQYMVQLDTVSVKQTVVDSMTFEGRKYYGVETDHPMALGIRQYVHFGNNSFYLYFDKVTGSDIGSVSHKILDMSKKVNEEWKYEHDSETLPGVVKYVYVYKITDDKVDVTFKGVKYTKGYKILSTTTTTMMGVEMPASTIEYTWVCGLGNYQTKNDGTVFSTMIDYKY